MSHSQSTLNTANLLNVCALYLCHWYTKIDYVISLLLMQLYGELYVIFEGKLLQQFLTLLNALSTLIFYYCPYVQAINISRIQSACMNLKINNKCWLLNAVMIAWNHQFDFWQQIHLSAFDWKWKNFIRECWCTFDINKEHKHSVNEQYSMYFVSVTLMAIVIARKSMMSQRFANTKKNSIYDRNMMFLLTTEIQRAEQWWLRTSEVLRWSWKSLQVISDVSILKKKKIFILNK